MAPRRHSSFVGLAVAAWFTARADRPKAATMRARRPALKPGSHSPDLSVEESHPDTRRTSPARSPVEHRFLRVTLTLRRQTRRVACIFRNGPRTYAGDRPQETVAAVRMTVR